MRPSNALNTSSEIAETGAPRSSVYKEHPKHVTFPTLEDQIRAHKDVYNHLQIEPVLELVHHYTDAALPDGADFWGTIVSCSSGHHLIDTAAATRKLAVVQPFNDQTNRLPTTVQRTTAAQKAFGQLKELQPYDIHVVAMQLGRTNLGGRSVLQRKSVHLAGEYPLGVREVADMLRLVGRLSSPQDLGIDCSADRFGEREVPCFFFEDRAIKLGIRDVESIDYSFAEATWFMPGGM